MTSKRKNRGFTLFEMMVSVAAIAMIAGTSVVGITEMRTSLRAQKLEQDVAAINSAVRVYLANGGKISNVLSEQQIIDKLKTVAKAENRKEIAGLRGSMIDPRLEVVKREAAVSAADEPRVVWNPSQQRFDVVRDGTEAGVLGFRLNRARMLDTPAFDEDDRVVRFKLAKTSNWVWDYFDSSSGGGTTFGPVNTGATSSQPFGLPNTPSGPVGLNPPSFNPVGGSYPLGDYDSFEVTISDPNPGGASQMFHSTDGTNWTLYTGDIITVQPGDSIEAVSVTLDPDNWANSGMELSSYLADPVKLALSMNIPKNPIMYPEAGGEMVPGEIAATEPVGTINISLANNDEVPIRYQSSDDFVVLWSYDGSDPRDGSGSTTESFADGYPGTAIDYSLPQWPAGANSITVSVVAKAFETDVLLDSELSVSEVTIDRLQLSEPISNLDESDTFTADQEMTFAPQVSQGNLPVGWRIYYTTNGDDPGVGDDGEPLTGSLYTGAFDIFTGSSITAEVKARLYGPSGRANWFVPSPLFSTSVTRWTVPEWNGYIGGDFSNNTFGSFNNIKQHVVNGHLDPSFNPGDGLNERGRAVVLQPDGKAIVAGDFTTAYGVPRNRIARFNTDGSLDMSFDPGAGLDDEVLGLALQSDGKILVGGKFRTCDNQSYKGLVRLNSDGSIDYTYSVGQAVHSDDDGWVHSIDIQSDGMAIVGGCFSRYNSQPASSLVRVDTDGSWDNTFDTTPGVNGYLHTVKIQPDGKVVIGGSFYQYDNVSRQNIARVNTDGSNDSSFDPGRGANKDVYTVSLFPDGKIFIGGNFSDVNKILRKGVARLNSNGSVDGSFDIGNGNGIPSWIIYASGITSDGKVLVGGNLRSYNSVARSAFKRLDTDGTIDSSYNPEDLPQHSYIYGVAVLPDDRALTVGDFPEAFVASGANVAKLDTSNGALDAGFEVGSGADAEVSAVLKLASGDVLVGGAFDQMKGQSRKRLALMGPDGSLQPLSLNIDGGDVFALAEQEDGKLLIGGNFETVNGSSYGGIARLNANGSLDTSFSPPSSSTTVWVQTHSWKSWIGYWDTVTVSGFDDTVRSILPLEDGTVLVGGSFDKYGSTSQNALALLNPDASLNSAFSVSNGNTPSSGSVYDMLLMPNGKLVYCGSFSGEVRRINVDGTPDSSFTPDSINGNVTGIAVQEDGRLLIGGEFTSVDNKNRKRVAVLSSNGSIHSAFNSSNGANGNVLDVAALEGGKAVIFGSFSNYGGNTRKGTACLNANGSLDTGFVNPAISVTAIKTTD